MKSNRQKLGILASRVGVAVAMPAMLLASAGTAHAVPGQGLNVDWTASLAGLNVTVQNTNNLAGKCTYDATAIGLFAPPYHHSFDLAANGTANWFIPVIPVGTTWRTVVRCLDPASNLLTGYFEQTSSY